MASHRPSPPVWGLRGALELSKLSLRVQLLLPQPKLVTCWLPLASLAFVFNGSAVIAAAPADVGKRGSVFEAVLGLGNGHGLVTESPVFVNRSALEIGLLSASHSFGLANGHGSPSEFEKVLKIGSSMCARPDEELWLILTPVLGICSLWLGSSCWLEDELVVVLTMGSIFLGSHDPSDDM
ncbi:hypothetical protein Vadar_009555 [Vaccinium darrowii]|uniref:Uncharacterized protein n=1 Tax=Vaccinium darrowii TaxID=229202 RepID=A0ACB7XPD7_9ERIC|nr:hypothetical protein Vadar_009555 [Vaccinium darrowii]